MSDDFQKYWDNLSRGIKPKEDVVKMTPQMVSKVWGTEEICVNNGLYCGKFLHIKKDYRCSIHYHCLKDETFYLVEGDVLLELYQVSDKGVLLINKRIKMTAGMSVHVAPQVPHRFTGVGLSNTILEISTKDSSTDSFRLTQSEKVPEDEKRDGDGRVPMDNTDRL